MNRWFRFYNEAIDDPKVQMLRPELFKFWVNLLCLASRNDGVLPDGDAEIAFALRLDSQTVAGFINELTEKGLLDDGDQLRPHNWDARQYKSDDSSQRVKKYRQNRKDRGLPAGADYKKHWHNVYSRDFGLCVYCGSNENLCIDHMVPINQGGTDHPDNLAIACKACNSGKAGRTPEQAGYTVHSKAAAAALSRYQLNGVTVTVTPPDTDTDTDTDNTQNARARASASPSGFDEFWKAYPHKVGRRAAEKSFALAVKRATLAEIMAGLAAYAAKTDDRPWCNPATWLNQDRWTDRPAINSAQKAISASLAGVSIPSAGSLPGRHFVALDSPQWRAWAAHRGRSPPTQDCRTERGIERGWFFETEWPPASDSLRAKIGAGA